MSWAKITLYGFKHYKESVGGDIFSQMALPDGIDRDTLISTIMMRGGEFEVLYASPDYMEAQIGFWSKRNYRTFEKWVEALSIEYNPLHNYDRHEEWTDKGNTSNSRNGNYTNIDTRDVSTTTAEDIKDTNDLTTRTDADSTTTNTVSAFDSSSYQPHDRSMTDADSTTRDTGDVTRDRDVVERVFGGDTFTNTHKDTDNGTSEGEHIGHLYGNIGVTTSQQMLQSELDISLWNIYEHISDLFVSDFCIPVYE